MILAVYCGEGYDLEIVEEGGYIFLHIHINSWGAGVIKGLKEDVQFVKSVYLKQGHDVVFATTQSEKVLKLWNMVEPCYEVRELDDNTWLGAWLTEEI